MEVINLCCFPTEVECHKELRAFDAGCHYIKRPDCQQEKLDSRDASRPVYFVVTEGSYLGRQRATETASLQLVTAGEDLPLSEMYTCVQYHRWYINLFQVQLFITGLDRLLGLQGVEAPRIPRQSAPESGKVVSATHRPPLPHRGFPWYSFPVRG